MSERRSRRSRLLAAGLGTLVAFAAAEVTLRVARTDVEVRSGRNPMANWAQVDAFCAYRGRPGEYLSRQKTVNREGFFSTPEIPREKPPGTLRIAFLGGSSTAGTVPYLADEQTWPWQVVERLRAAMPGRRIDFLNAAMPGFSTFESYGRLWSRVRFYDPDVVVVYHAWNDLYYFKNAAKAAAWRVNVDGGWGFDGVERVVEIPQPPVPGWAAWSSVLSFVHRTVAPDDGLVGEVGRLGRRAGPELVTDWDPAALDVFRENLRLLIAAQEALGFELHVCKQATLIVAGLDEELRGRCGYRLHGFDHDAHVRAFDAVYGVIDELVPAGRIIDLTHLSGSTENLVDHVHLNERGNGRVAEGVAEHLLRHVVRAAPSGR